MSSISPIPSICSATLVIRRLIPFIFCGYAVVCSNVFSQGISSSNSIKSVSPLLCCSSILSSAWFAIMKPIAISSTVKPTNINYWLVTHVGFNRVGVHPASTRTTYAASRVAPHVCSVKIVSVVRGYTIQELNILTIGNLV